MPVDYEIDEGQRLLITRGVGVVLEEELQECADRIRRDPRFTTEFDQIGDYRRATSTAAVTVAFLRESSNDWRFQAGTRRAYVADGEVFETLRILETFSEWGPGRIRVFRWMDEALGWLGRQFFLR